ncbi:AfsR/SARP family transcriptional regulator [Streptomyces xinghaiensis]|uniref:AfsR/SARP family transcriptional regulator n=1 Tax=Streptomyces xinghaiensis TaxID=1038928 RepID=UPI0012FF7D75|nr:BTAD domain-containing putative transcriptional regulator [Streptomyces xinghaiensis]
MLGPLELWTDGARLPLGPPKERCLLALLLYAAGRPVPADRLMDRIWDGEPPPSGTAALQPLLSRLRRRLRPVLGERAELPHFSRTYRLDVPEESVDLHRSRRLENRARELAREGDTGAAAGLLREAEALWRGEPFAEFPGAWAASLRDRLGEEHRALREFRVGLELDHGRHHELIGELREMTDEHPTAEVLHGQLMRALYRCGRHTEALAVYHRLRHRLHRKSGLPPLPELQRLHQQILQHDSASLAPPAPAALPAPAPVPSAGRCPDTLIRDIPTFTGRRDELRTLLAEDDPRATALPVTVVHGLAGVGKTALAVHAAHLLKDRYPDGRYHIELRSHGPRPAGPSEVLASLLLKNGMHPENLRGGLDELAALWRSQMADRRALLVIDDAEDSAQVRPLLPGSPACRVIVTSRHRLTDLEGAASLALDVPTEAEATALFARVTGSAGASDHGAVRRVVDLCGRHPLAVWLAASQLRHRDPWQAGDLADRLAAAGALDETDGVPAVGNAFRMSYAELSSATREVFRLLALHPGPDLTEHAAAAVCGTDPAAVRRSLRELTGCHLLEEPLPDRYRFHDLVRNFARGLGRRTDSSAERDAALRRLLDYFLTVADRADRLAHPARRRIDVRPGTPPPAVPVLADADDGGSWLDAERANLLAAADAAASLPTAHAGLFPHVLARAFDTWGIWNVAARLSEAALVTWRRRGDAAAEALCLVEQASALWNQGRHDDALHRAEQALAVSRATGDRWVRAEALTAMGRAHHIAGRRDEGDRCLDEALALHRAAGDRRGEAEALNVRGIAMALDGRHAAAAQHFRAVLDIEEEIGNRPGQIKALNNIGEVHRLRERHGDALHYYRQALALTRSVGGRQQLANLYNNLGLVHDALGEPDRALDYLLRAMDSCRTSPDPRCETEYLVSIGTVYRKTGRHEEAEAHFTRAERLARETGNRDGLRAARNALAGARAAASRPGHRH